MNKQMSVTEYAKLTGKSRQHVNNYLKSNRTLLGVLKSKKVGNQYVLTVLKEYYEKLSMQADSGFEATSKKIVS